MVTYGKRCSSATLRLSAAWNGKVHVSEFDVAGAANYFAPLVRNFFSMSVAGQVCNLIC